MPSQSLDARQREVEAAIDGPDRCADIALALVRASTRETLLFAGGKWDRFDRRFAREAPERVAVVELEESQVEFTRWFASFLADYRDGKPRDISLALVAGDRRGGKTFDAYFCQLAALIDVPILPSGLPTIGWTISRTFRQRDELEQLIASYLPDTFYRAQRAPEHRYTFAHGSYLRNLSADDPESMKQGRVDFLLYNEPQIMSSRAVVNGLYGTSDAGGLCVLAANPPSGPEGDWLRELKESIDEDDAIRKIARFFNFSSRDNTKIDQPARQRVAAIARKIDPESAEADAEGSWKRWGDLAYPAWDGRAIERGGMVGSPPPGAVDVTRQVTRREIGEPFEHVIGGDFQRRPQAAVVLKIYEVPGIDGYVYWAIDEIGVRGTEVELSTELMGAPHSLVPDSRDDRGAVWIADCSGSWQGAERIRGRTSFGLLEAEGWRVHPAEIIKLPGKSDHPKNPDVGQRLGLMMRLMVAKRFRVAPECEWLIASLAKCVLRRADTGRRIPGGRYAHVTDAAGYPIWRLEPKPRASRPPRLEDVRTFAQPRTGGFL